MLHQESLGAEVRGSHVTAWYSRLSSSLGEGLGGRGDGAKADKGGLREDRVGRDE